jgi:hypothetical protein
LNFSMTGPYIRAMCSGCCSPLVFPVWVKSVFSMFAMCWCDLEFFNDRSLCSGDVFWLLLTSYIPSLSQLRFSDFWDVRMRSPFFGFSSYRASGVCEHFGFLSKVVWWLQAGYWITLILSGIISDFRVRAGKCFPLASSTCSINSVN